MARNDNERIQLTVKDGFAVITLNIPERKNALSLDLYKRLSSILQTIDAREDVFVTVLTGKGDFFSAGADVTARLAEPSLGDETDPGVYIQRLSSSTMALTRSLHRHTKVLIAALNGPAIGYSAAILGWFDFIYAVEQAYILTPFSRLSLVSEGGASLSFPRRMGISKANEALIMGKKLGAAELQANGFFNKIFPASSQPVFMTSLMSYLQEKFQGLDQESCLMTKQLIRQTLPDPDPSNIREIFAASQVMATGKPAAKFAQIAAKTLRHKI